MQYLHLVITVPADGLARMGARPSAYHTKHPNEYQLYFDHVHFMQNVCSKNVWAEDNSRVISPRPCGLQASWLFQVFPLADHTISHILINLTVQRWDKANTTSMVQTPNKVNRSSYSLLTPIDSQLIILWPGKITYLTSVFLTLFFRKTFQLGLSKNDLSSKQVPSW